ncbi:MAG: riboflavin biosynthesis protein RibF [Bacteroidetes bacterium]|nr:riboflavin biosynthesis protein RibF [Bacteroidota bacterium]
MRVFEGFENFKGVKNPILTIGTFDGVHVGHQHIIRQMNTEANKVKGESTLLVFHPHPRWIINDAGESPKLIQTLEEKLEKLAEVGMKNVIIQPFDKAFSCLSANLFVENVLIKTIKAHHLFIGYDHRFGNAREGDVALLKNFSAKGSFLLTEISAVEINTINVSSTKIRNALTSGDIIHANELLNSIYCVSGVVEDGIKLGRTIDFPTANISHIDPHKLLPKNGVYAGKATFDNQKHDAIFNLGLSPTVKNIETQPILEVHLLNFSGDLYGKSICVSFEHRLRDEKKFDSVRELKNQILQDESVARTLLRSH